MPRTTAALLLSASFAMSAQAAQVSLPQQATLYKSPSCGCCAAYADYLESRGVAVQVVQTQDLGETKSRLGIPHGLGSCHSLEMDGYVIEGHVPGAALDRLFTERPEVAGIALPGMPAGTPGMPGERQQELTVHQFDDESTATFMILPAEAG
ncbi:DUF411 domain-containing protein [Halomonas sp. HP20-15]|uniref:DUF411 domain-containing protein n=1 Tax=Halomonas sp. HP20-15 TaxID=3085901 RepID=UPI0029815A99|nr:DUF411 domain-containing protein [Halomonas sp. HP20-15]MDW5376522.1 DUF411 domain-containing protein [Halomonas sp. HP20-15]